MTSQSPRIYVYKITFEEVLYYYYGVHKEKKFGEYYMGSPITHKWVWDFYTPNKQILEVFPYTDEGWLDAQEVEKRLIRPVYNTDQWCLNESCGGIFSIDQKRKAGKIGGMVGGKKVGKKAYELGTGIFAMTAEEKREVSLRAAETQRKNGTGIFAITAEQRRENVKKSHETQKKEGKGFFGMTRDQKSEAGKKGGRIGGIKAQETLSKNKLGIYALTTEERVKNGEKGGKISGKKCYENKTGIFSLTEEEKKQIRKKAGDKAYELGVGVHALTTEQRSQNTKRIQSQRWMCLVTNHVSSPSGLTMYQKARGIDTSQRVRIK